MKTNRRSQKNRADKYSRRAGSMLDQFHWEEAEAYFLSLMETAVLTVDEVRELTWAQVRDNFESINILDRQLHLRDEYLEGFKKCLQTRIGFYGEDLNSSDGSPRLFSKQTMKEITKKMDQFRE